MVGGEGQEVTGVRWCHLLSAGVVRPFLHFSVSCLCPLCADISQSNPCKRERKQHFCEDQSSLSLLPTVHRLCTEFPKSVKSREELAEYLTVIVFTASAQHAAVNFGQVSDRSSGTIQCHYYIQNKNVYLNIISFIKCYILDLVLDSYR